MEREPIKTKGISLKVAFFLSTIAKSPEIYLKTQTKGLTEQGQLYFTEKLNKDMKPLLDRINEDKTITQMAQKYLQSIQSRLEGGTDILSLEDNYIDKISFF